MANDIYKFIQTGLGSLMSPRAARRMLNGALRAKNLHPDRVTPEEMNTALFGPLQRDLKKLLPGEAVDRQLKHLSQQLEQTYDAPSAPVQTRGAARTPGTTSAAPVATLPETTPEVTAIATEADVAATHSEIRSEETELGSEPGTEPQDEAQTGVAPEPQPSETQRTASSERATRSLDPEPVDPETHPLKTYDQAMLERAALTFAQLEHVRMVAVATERGDVTFSRGSGAPLETLSRLASLGLRLLGRSGHLRSYYLSHDQGQLFLFPLAPYVLILIGNPEVNLGLMFATLQKVKEDV